MTKTNLQSYKFQNTLFFQSEKSDVYVMKVQDMADADQPRQKMKESGPSALSLQELLATILGHGTKKEHVMAMASRILQEYGERTIINEVNPSRLAESLNIPFHKACQITASLEIGRRFYAYRSGKAVYITDAKSAYDYLKEMGDLIKEQLRGIYLNSRYKVIYEEIISIGSATSSIVHPREVFRPAIEHGASAIVVAHNHPSGDIKETFSDLETTERLLIAANYLGIDLLDHLIISKNKYKSIIAPNKKLER